MAKLNENIKVFIVQQFAMYQSPSEIVAIVKEIFGIETTRQQIHFYNVEVNDNSAKKWKKLFVKTREKFLEDASMIAIAHKSVRLNELDTMYKAERRKPDTIQNPRLKLDILEQAAKESGDAFTNRRDLNIDQKVSGSLDMSIEKKIDSIYGKDK